MVDEGINGLLFPAGDTEALAGCLNRMLSDESGRVEMGRRGREKAVNQSLRSARRSSKRRIYFPAVISILWFSAT